VPQRGVRGTPGRGNDAFGGRWLASGKGDVHRGVQLPERNYLPLCTLLLLQLRQRTLLPSVV
jgi:hypothetical protein